MQVRCCVYRVAGARLACVVRGRCGGGVGGVGCRPAVGGVRDGEGGQAVTPETFSDGDRQPVSWDACLQAADGGYVTPEWNFTHNTNGMIAAAYEAVTGNTTPQCGGPLGRAIGPAWWERLDGQPGGEGAEYLAVIVTGLESDPARYRAMNPE